MAGTMGGLSTEIDEASTDLVIEAAHFSAEGTAKMARRHKLHSEASYRFERGVDRELPLRGQRQGGRAAVRPGRRPGRAGLHARLGRGPAGPDLDGGGLPGPGGRRGLRPGRRGPAAARGRLPVRETRQPAPTIAPWRAERPRRPRGRPRTAGRRVAVLEVTPPSWRPDLTDPADLAEEVIRLEGYENVPARLPRALAGRGLTPAAAAAPLGRAGRWPSPVSWRCCRRRSARGPTRTCSGCRPRTCAARRWRWPTRSARTSRCCAPPCCPACSASWPGTSAGVRRHRAVRDRPGLPAPARRPRPRPQSCPSTGGPRWPNSPPSTPPCPTSRCGSAAVLAGDARARRLVGHGTRRVLGGRDRGGPRGGPDLPGAARHPGRQVRALASRAAARPSTPGSRRRREIRASGWPGMRGELHPRVIQAFGLPARTCAVELDLSVLFTAAETVGTGAGAAAVQLPAGHAGRGADRGRGGARRRGRGGAGGGRPPELLEGVRLFDVYTGAQVGEDRKSLAYTLRFRAPDRTLTAAETTAARDAAVAEATRRVGAVLRS